MIISLTTREDIGISCCLTPAGIGIVMLSIGGIVYAAKERTYQKARRMHLNSLTYFNYPIEKQKLVDRLQEITLEIERYQALLDPSVRQTLTTTTTTSITASYGSTSSALYAMNNPANPNRTPSLANATDDKLNIPTKSV